MKKKRLRIFAGPNGSGKSTITKIVLDHAHLGTYVNADEIKVLFEKKRYLDFASYGVILDKEKFIEMFHASSLSSRINSIEETLSNIIFQDNIIRLNDGYKIEDYFVSFVTSYIWNLLLECSTKFTIETVMSHPSKLDFMRLAKEKGFKIYLYFVSLVDPELNKRRVQARVAQGGHNVNEEKIIQRYFRTMEYLLEALRIADKVYLFDNSAGEPNMFAVKENGTIQVESEYIPKWFDTYVIQKLYRS